MIHHAFLSTLSLRRATIFDDILGNLLNNFYPRSPCGERPVHFDTLSALAPISIHALLAESDPEGPAKQPKQIRISIHALLAESDARSASKLAGMSISIHALLAESDVRRRGI